MKKITPSRATLQDIHEFQGWKQECECEPKSSFHSVISDLWISSVAYLGRHGRIAFMSSTFYIF